MRQIFILAVLTTLVAAAPIPTGSGASPGSQLIGESFSQSLCFENTGDATGYQPQFEIVTPPGIALTSATFHGAGGVIFAAPCASAQCDVANPSTGVVRTIDGNETFYVVGYPIGSVVPSLPKACMDLTFSLESTAQGHVQLGTALDIDVVPLFSLGETPEDDGNYTYGTPLTLTVDPNVFILKKHNDAREGERATGPSWPIHATIDLDVANSETVKNVKIVDVLDPAMRFVSLDSAPGCSVVGSLPTSGPGGQFELDCGDVTGGIGIDKSIVYTYYIDENDSSGSSVLPPDGAHKILTNTATASMDFNGSALPDVSAESNVTAMSITMYKTSTFNDITPPPGLSPGDEILYRLEMQTSDFFEHTDVNVTDILGDGQTAQNPLPNEYNLSGGVSGAFAAANMDICSAKDPATGACEVVFRLSDQLAADGHSAVLPKGATIRIGFETIVDENYTVINGQKPLAMGDSVTNHASVEPDIPGVGPGTPDGSDETNTIVSETFTKTVYAINGSTAIAPPYNIKPGDTVTYRLEIVMPVTSFYDYNLTDYLPLPFFTATEVTGFDSTTPPPAGKWGTGPDNNYTSPPTFSTNAADNKLLWHFGDQTANHQKKIIDLLFTVTASHRPMADSLALANIATTSFKDAAGDTSGSGGIINVVTMEPSLEMNKTIVATSNPASSLVPAPAGFERALENVDANDTITFAIRLKNTGRASAYNIGVKDTLPSGLVNCQVTGIDGNSSASHIGGDLFTDAYRLDEMPAQTYADVNYTCVVDQNASPGPDLNNSASLEHYYSTSNTADQNDSTNFVQTPVESRTTLKMAEKMDIVKTIVATSIPDTAGTSLNQGEIATFEINVTLGEGEYRNFSLQDDTCSTPTLVSTSANVQVAGSTVTVTGTGGSVDGNLSYRCDAQMIASGTNTATVQADVIGDKSAQASWTVVDPVVQTSKTMSPAQADAGDLVTVDMGWTNDTSHPAYKCKIIDPLDTSVFDLSTFTMTTTPTDYTCTLVGNTVQCVYDGNLSKPCTNGPAAFTLNVRNDVNTSGTLTNRLGFSGFTLPDGHPGEGNTTLNGDVESNATANLQLLSPALPVKTFTATSEYFTDPGDTQLGAMPPVAVGEVVDVRIDYGFYEGRTLDVDLSDVFMNKGLVYVPGTMRISRDDENLTVADTAVNTVLTGVSVGTAVSLPDTSVAADENGTVVHVGDVVNGNHQDGNVSRHLTLYFKVKVRNATGVQAGVTLQDRGRTTYTDSGTGTVKSQLGAVRSLQVLEPAATIDKDVNQTTVQAGTSLGYSIKVCNDEQNASNNPNHATSAFDWNVTDRLPDEITLTAGPSVRTGTTGANVTLNTAGQEINASIDRLDRGECIYIDYNATVLPTVHFGQRLTNTAGYQTTSLPGSYGNTGGPLAGLDDASSHIDGERTGDGSRNDINDLHGEDSVTVVASEAVIEKQLVDPQTYYAIGEKAHYRIRVSLPKGEANATVVADKLPGGLEFNASDVHYTYGPNLTLGHQPPNVTQNGQIVSFDFGDITASSISAITIDYNVTVANILGNQDNTALRNEANVSYVDPNNIGGRTTLTPANPADPVTVGEPNLFMQKTITAGALKAQAGSIVSWQVEITNNGHTTAFAVDWNDTLPPHLADIHNAALAISGTPAVLTGTTTQLASSDLNEQNQTLSLPKFDLPVGTTLTITFDSNVTNDAVSGESQTNDTNASYRSLLEGTPGARDGSQCGDDDDDTTLNNYCESASQTLNIDAAIAIDKHLLGTNDRFTIGETVTYTMRVWLIEGITKSVELNDSLPAGLAYVSHHCQDAGGTLISYGCALTSSSPVVIDFGDVSNPADGNKSNDYIDVELTARVMNELGNQNGDTPKNGDTAASPVTIHSDVNSSAVSQPVEITITEPDLDVTKTVSPSSQSLGDIVTYRIEVRHASASTSDAYDINLTDTLPAGLAYIPGSASGATVTQNGQILTFGFAYLAQGDSKVVTYKARIDAGAAVGVDLNNSLDTVFGSLQDANGSADGGRNGSDGIGPDATVLNNYARHAEAALTPNDYVLDINKTVTWVDDRNGDGLVNAGDYLEYNIAIVNPFTYSVGDVNFTDTLPIETTYLLNTLTLSDMSGGNTIDDSNTSELKALIVELVSGETNYVTYRVEINSDVPAGTTIVNTAAVDSNRTVPTVSNEANITTDIRGIAAVPEKNITGSSETFTTLPDVAVGEIVDVVLTFSFTGGTTRQVLLQDLFDTQAFAFVPGSMRLERNTTAIEVSQPALKAAFGTSALTIPVDDSNITIDGSGISLDVGDVFNAHYDGLNPSAALIVHLQLQVRNTASVNRSDDLVDRGAVTFERFHSDTNTTSVETLRSPEVSVHVVEPLPQIQKSNANPAAAAGDVVTYTLKLCNDEANTAADTAPAFDWNATDTLPAVLQPTGTPTVSGVAGASATFAGQSLQVTLPRVDPGQCALVTYDATVLGTAQAGEHIVNTAAFETTSLPGSTSGERTGGGGIDDLRGTAQSTVVVDAPSLVKAVSVPQSYYAVGESVEYNLTIGLPGSAKGVKITDMLPAGLVYETGSARLVVPSGITAVLQNVSQAGNVVEFDIGDVDITTRGAISLEFNATVDNVLGNQQGTHLGNDAELSYTEANGSTAVLPIVSAPDIVVGEPEIDMQKHVVSGQLGSQAGDTVRFEVTLHNMGTTTAYGLDWNDTLPPHLGQIQNIVIGGTAYHSGTTTPIVAGDAILSTRNAPNDTVALPPLDLAAGDTLTITFDSIVQSGAVAGELLVNRSASVWKSHLGTVYRDGSDGIGGALDDYAAQALAALLIDADIAIDKQLIGKTKYAIGEEATYRLSVYFIRGITRDVNVTDVLPAGLTYLSHTHQSSAVALSYNTTSAAVNRGDAHTVTVLLGDVNNSATNADHIDIDIRVRVDNVMNNQDGVPLTNGGAPNGTKVGVRYRGSLGTPAEQTVKLPVDLQIVEPQLTLEKTVNPLSQAIGKEVAYRIDLYHAAASTATAYDVNFTDTLPSGMHYIPGSASGNAVVTYSGGKLHFFVPSLTQTDRIGVTYRARIDAAVSVGTALTNDAIARYGSIPDANGSADGGRNGSDVPTGLNDYFTRAQATVTANDDAFVVATKDVFWIDDNNSDGMINAGDALRYEVNITNTGTVTVGDVHFEDPLPVETTYLIGTLLLSDYAGGNNTVDDSNTSRLIADIKQLNVGQTVQVWFDVRINDDVPGGVTILNQGVVDSNRTVDYLSSWPKGDKEHQPTPVRTVTVPLFDGAARALLFLLLGALGWLRLRGVYGRR